MAEFAPTENEQIEDYCEEVDELPKKYKEQSKEYLKAKAK